MKTPSHTRLLALIGAGALASCASQPATQKIPVSASIRPDSTLSGKVFQEINAYRRNHGKRELQRHSGLDRLAQQHSEYLRAHRGSFSLNGRNVSHIGFEGRALVARERYYMESVSENVAAANYPGTNYGPLLVKLWDGSKDHRKNMLDSWTHSGIGVVVDSDGTVFATQLFSTLNGATQMSMRERFNSF